MAPYISLALILWMIAPGTKSDTAMLLKILKMRNSLWFGQSYSRLCPNSKNNWPLCYNPRPHAIESTLERVGIPADVQLSKELEVIFSAPAEWIDVCGELIKYASVEPFHLPTNGIGNMKLLKKGAEIYRKFPSITWPTDKFERSDLLIIDAGYIKVHAYVQDIQLNATKHLVGEVTWPYSPPANPALHTNPNLIVLIQRNPRRSIALDELFGTGCVDNGISAAKANSCRRYLATYFRSVTIKGLQMFYTDGSSLYEQYRACTKSLFCTDACISKFKSYVRSQLNKINFADVNPEQLDSYVNLNFMSASVLSYYACCYWTKLPKPFSFRAVPGEDTYAAAYMINEHKDAYRMLELSGSADMALVCALAPRSFCYDSITDGTGCGKGRLKNTSSRFNMVRVRNADSFPDTETLYSVLMVGPDEPKYPPPVIQKTVYGYMWMANLKYQELESTPGMRTLIYYTGPNPTVTSAQKYYILLYSHKTAINNLPAYFYGKGCAGRCNWDLSKLPNDFKLRAMTWFVSSKDEYTMAKLLQKAGIVDSCFPADPKHWLTCYNKFRMPQFQDQSITEPDKIVLSKKKKANMATLQASISNVDPLTSDAADVNFQSNHSRCPSTNPLVAVTLVSMFIQKVLVGA